MHKKLVLAFLLILLTTSTISFISKPTFATPTTVTEVYISDDSGDTLAMDDAINPGTGEPWYGPKTWDGAVYAWGPTDGSGAFWNSYLQPSGYKTELLGSGANWIWKPTGTSGQTLPDGRTVYQITDAEAVTGDIVKFKRSFDIPTNAFNIEGTLLIGTDNAFYLNVNTVFITEGNFYNGYDHTNFRGTTGFPIEGSVELPDPGEPTYPWSVLHSIDISSELTTGTNALEIVGINEYSTPSNPGTPTANPAGVIYKLTVEYELATIEKTVSPDEGYLGDVLTVTLVVEVPTGLTMTVEDELPNFLGYVPGTFMVDSVSVIPTVAGGVISTEVGEGDHTITFDVIIDSVEATIVTGTNWAYLKYDTCTVDEDSADITTYPYCGFHKVAILESTQDGDDIIEVGEEVVWTFKIMVTNLFGWTMVDVVVTDRLGAELELDEPIPFEIWSPDHGDDPDQFDWDRKGNVKMTWTVGDLEPGETAILNLQVSTRKKKGKQAYTSEGCNYEFNSGATLKFLYELEPCLFIQLSAHTGSMLFDVPGEWPHFQPYCMLWPEGGTATIAFEDLPIGGGNDYDYNNFVTDVSVLGRYSEAGMAQLKFTFDAQARGAAYHHDLHLLIPASTFGSGGVYIMEFYETDGSFIGSTSGSFVNTADLDLTVFADTWDALPPNPSQSWSGNTYDGSGLQLGRRTVVTFEFTTPFSFDLSTYTPEYVGVHGDNLFFDPYLYVRNTGESIHITDPRLIVVPTDWEWPQERAAVWTVYPYNAVTGEGVTAGNPPTFTTYWYTETPTDSKWTP